MPFAAWRLSRCLSGCWPAAAQTQTRAASEPPPKADAGTTVQAKCIDENDHYVRSGKQPLFVIELANLCEQRMKCRVFAYVTSAKGAAQGRGTIVLAPKSQGAAAKNVLHDEGQDDRRQFAVDARVPGVLRRGRGEIAAPRRARHDGGMAADPERWPELPYAAWADTAATLQLWTQMVGKIRLALTPWLNHSWHVALYVTARGLTTSPIPMTARSLPDRFRLHRSRAVAAHQRRPFPPGDAASR